MELSSCSKYTLLCRSIYTLIAAILPISASVVLFLTTALPLWIPLIFTLVWCTGLLFLLFVYFPLRYRRLKYAITADHILTVSGVWLVSTRRIRFDAIRYITILHGPLDRRFNLAAVVVSAAGGQIFLDGISIEQAEALMRRLP